MLNSFQSVLILMIISRIDPVTDAGVFTIAFAIGNLMLTIGQYGIRQFQVSDVQEKYSFREYVGARGHYQQSDGVVSFFYVGIHYWTGAYDLEKSIAVFLICLSKTIDSVEDVFQGRLQQRGPSGYRRKSYDDRLFRLYPYFYPVLYIDKKSDHGLFAFVFCVTVSLHCFKHDSNKKLSAYGRYMESRKYKTYVYGVFSPFSCRLSGDLYRNAPKYSIDAVFKQPGTGLF